jgi:hypothetical protein
MELLEPYSIRMSEADKRLAETLRRVLGEKSIGGTLRRLLREAGQEFGLAPEQPAAGRKAA